MSSESDLVLARPMMEADPLTMLLDKCKCKCLSPAVDIRICAHDVDKRSFILFSIVLLSGRGFEYLPARLEIGED